MGRFLIFLLTAFLLAIFQSTLTRSFFPSYLMPDLMVLLVIFLGISFPLYAGALLVLFCGLLYDTLSGESLGLLALVYLCLFFSLKVLDKFIIMGETLLFRIILVAVLMVFQALLMTFLPLFMGRLEQLSWPLWSWILPQVAVTCMFCWPVFYLYRKLDLSSRGEMAPPVA